ncbi:MAG: hypothetical protein RL398_2392 [Planctomycetota bacterium]
MLFAPGHPWFVDALECAAVRRRDRVLALFADTAQVAALAQLVGKEGAVTVVQPDLAIAEELAALGLGNVEVLGNAIRGVERFGSFDALVCAPTANPDLPLGAYGELPRKNLRPGGRFALDLPAPRMLPQFVDAATALGWPAERLGKLAGPADDALADVLRNAGLRRVRSLLGSHLVHAPSPADFLDGFAAALALAASERADLEQALVRAAGTVGAAEFLVHRSRVEAQR